jgi:hypothetical protein
VDVSSQPTGVSEHASSRPCPGPRYRRLRHADLELIAFRHLAGASDGAIARQLGVDRSSVRRARKRPTCLELIAAERKRERKRAESRRYRARKKEQRERAAPALPEVEEKGEREPRGSASGSPTWVDGVPLFPDTPEGQAARFAYYEARKLNHLPASLLDYHDVVHGRETPAERRARAGGASRRR